MRGMEVKSDKMNPIVVNHLLDKAVATAARELLPWDGELDLGIAQRVCSQLDHLTKRKANFHDPVTPVLYSTWYQPGHVNLAIVVAHRMVRQWREFSLGGDEMRILDIGGGTLALPIAFDILQILGKLDINVRMLVIEPSREMEYCGRRIRHLFRTEVSSLRSRCETTAFFGTRLRFRGDSPFFFASMHSMYPDIERTFEECWSKRQPVYGLATINAAERTNLESLERYCLSEYDRTELNLKAFTLGGSMPMTLNYRRDLWKRVQSSDHELGAKFRGLLTNPDIPDWPEGMIVVKEYSRKPDDEDEDLPW